MEFCPVCMLRQALAGGIESSESSASEEAVKPTTPEQAVQRFEHCELVTGEDGKPVEVGRGAMGVTYKAFDIDLQCPVTLKLINEQYLGHQSARLRFLREARRGISSPDLPRLRPSQNWEQSHSTPCGIAGMARGTVSGRRSARGRTRVEHQAGWPAPSS